LTEEDLENAKTFQPTSLQLLGIVDVPEHPLQSAKNKFEGDIDELTPESVYEFVKNSNKRGRAAVKNRLML